MKALVATIVLLLALAVIGGGVGLGVYLWDRAERQRVGDEATKEAMEKLRKKKEEFEALEKKVRERQPD